MKTLNIDFPNNKYILFVAAPPGSGKTSAIKKMLPDIEAARDITITPYAAFEIAQVQLYQIKHKPLWIDGVHAQPHIFDLVLMRLDSKVPTIITCDAPEFEIIEKVGLSVLQKIKSESHYLNFWAKVEQVEPKPMQEVEVQEDKGFMKRLKTFFMVN